jgi:two-component system KDP operon response regulator KdpE
LCTSLTAAGYWVASADDAAGALAGLASEKPDVIILDLGLPDSSGLNLIIDIRRRSPVPILVLSTRDDERSKVEVLDLGADDFVSKPFGMPELSARLRAAVRHAFQAQGETTVFISGDLAVDLASRQVTRAGELVKLSPKEFELLRHLVAHAGKVLTHRQLLREVWGAGPGGGGAISAGVYPRATAKARSRPDPTRPAHILPELGVGYRLQLPPEQRALPNHDR